MSPERRPTFTEREQEEIGKMAVLYADLGEDFIEELAKERNKLHLRVIAEMTRNLGSDGLVEWAKTMEHEIGVVQEVIRRARLVMRFEGRDMTSRMVEARKEAGLPVPDEKQIWGSV